MDYRQNYVKDLAKLIVNSSAVHSAAANGRERIKLTLNMPLGSRCYVEKSWDPEDQGKKTFIPEWACNEWECLLIAEIMQHKVAVTYECETHDKSGQYLCYLQTSGDGTVSLETCPYGPSRDGQIWLRHIDEKFYSIVLTWDLANLYESAYECEYWNLKKRMNNNPKRWSKIFTLVESGLSKNLVPSA